MLGKAKTGPKCAGTVACGGLLRHGGKVANRYERRLPTLILTRVVSRRRDLALADHFATPRGILADRPGVSAVGRLNPGDFRDARRGGGEASLARVSGEWAGPLRRIFGFFVAGKSVGIYSKREIARFPGGGPWL